MSTAAIRDTIEMAKLHEQQYRHLARLCEQYVNSKLPAAVRLPNQGATQCLIDFVIAYIDHVPRLLDIIEATAKDASIEEYCTPFLHLAKEFFLKPPEMIAKHVGLEELMDEAYLAHRLIEEVNDRFMRRATIPLTPLDMTMSNLIIHNLIGEPFANELDEAVHYTVDRALVKEYVYDSDEFQAYIDKRKNHHSQQQHHWPCLTEKLPISLQLV